MVHIGYSVGPVYLLEPTPGMQCPLAGVLEQFPGIFAVSSGSCAVQFSILPPKWPTQKLSCNHISAACHLNEHGGKHCFRHHLNLCLNNFEIKKMCGIIRCHQLQKRRAYNQPCAFLLLATFKDHDENIRTYMDLLGKSNL